MNWNRSSIWMIALTAVLAGSWWHMQGQHEEARQDLVNHQRLYKKVLTDVNELFARRSLLEGSDAMTGHYEYFNTHSMSAQMGPMNVQPGKPKSRKHYEDATFELELDDKNKACSREQIVNFLYNAENQRARMRTTRLKLTPASSGRGGRLPSGLDRRDAWKWSATFTQRTQTTAAQ